MERGSGTRAGLRVYAVLSVWVRVRTGTRPAAFDRAHAPRLTMSAIPTAGLCLALFASLAGCSDSEPAETIEGVSPDQNGTLQPDATTTPGGDLAPEQQQDPNATLEPDATLQPDTTAAP